MRERWRDIPRYAGLYQASDRGRIRRRRGRVVLSTAKVRRTGYLVVTLSAAGARRQAKVHRLVLEAFVGPCPRGMEARHLDGDRANNRLSNLQWGTHAKNIADRCLVHKTTARGERHGRAKLTIAEVKRIHVLRAKGFLQREIAAQIGITQAHVSRVLGGENWAHLRPRSRGASK